LTAADIIASAAGPMLIESSGDQLVLRGATELHLLTNGFDYRWPLADGSGGQVLKTNGAGILSWGPDNGAPAGPTRSIQFNNAGAFDGSPDLLFNAGANSRTIVLRSPSAAAGQTRLTFEDSLGTQIGSLAFFDSTDQFSVNGSAGLLLNGLGTVGLQLNGGAPNSDKWPATNGTPGQVLTAGAGGLMSWTTPASGGGDAAAQTYPLASTSAALAVYGGAGPVGDLIGSIVVPPVDVQIGELATVCAQAGAGSFRLGVYNAAGVLLGQTGNIAPAVGILLAPTLAPINLAAGNAVYFCVWCNANGATVYTQSGRFNGAGITLNFEAVNVAGLAGLPANVAGSLSNRITSCVWVLGGP
jgi:hypothetical protein